MNEKWKYRFLSLAKHISTFSKDPSTKVGAVIVDRNKRIISLGYNGFPIGVYDLEERYLDRERKLKFIVHAELNAILNSKRSLEDTILFVYPLFPCNECAKAIIQSGIKHVVAYVDSNEAWKESFDYSKIMFDEAGVKYEILRNLQQYDLYEE